VLEFPKTKLYNQSTRQISCEIMESVWSDCKTFKLIELFEQYDCLYNVQSNDYHHRTRKNAAIKEIAHVLNITGAYKFECDCAHGWPYAPGGRMSRVRVRVSVRVSSGVN